MDLRDRYYALILAAGFSSRAQGFKMALPLAGRPVLHHVLSALALAVDGAWVVTGYEGARIENLVREWAGPCEEIKLPPDFVRTVHNPIYKEGMMSSVLAGARVIPEGSFLFILPGDYPLLATSAFQSLRTAAMAARDSAQSRGAARGDTARGDTASAGAFIPRCNGKNGHPVLLVPECAASLRSLAEGQFAVAVGDGGSGNADIPAATLRAFLAQWNPAYIDVSDEGVLIDLDTPEDYERIKTRMQKNQ